MTTRISFAASTLAAMALAAMTLAAPVRAETCQRLAAAGDGPTKDIATMMSTHGLDNIITNKGLKPTGAISTKCVPGTILVECKSWQKACK
jgi:hypothetical protein